MFIQKSYRILSFGLISTLALSACELGGTTNDSMTSLVAAKKAANAPVVQNTPPKLKDPVKKKPNEVGAYFDLVNIKNDPNADYILINDIDMGAHASDDWTPFGNADKPFTGHFDGNGHTIKNFRHTYGSRTTALSLFGVNAGVIDNLTIDTAELGSPSDVAIIANENRGAINGVHVVKSWIAGAESVGGLVGVNKGTITNSAFSGDISSIVRQATDANQNNVSLISNPKHLYVGGTAGYSHAGGTVVGSISIMGIYIEALFMHTSGAGAAFAQVVGKNDPAVTYTVDAGNVAPMCAHAVLNNNGTAVAPYDNTTKGKITPTTLPFDISCDVVGDILPDEIVPDSLIYTGGEIYRGGIAADNQGVILNSMATGRIGIDINN